MSKRIHISTPISVQLESGETVDLKPGTHVVSDEVANHWYVKAHTGDDPEDDGANWEQVANELSDELTAQGEVVAGLSAEVARLSKDHDDMKARAEKAEKEASEQAEQVKVLQDAVVEMTNRAEKAEARVKVLEEEAAKAASDSAKTSKAKA